MNSKILIWSLWTSILGGLFSPVFATAPLKIITEEWPPFNYIENGEVKGVSTEIVKLVMKELNVNYPIEVLPGSRGMKVLDTGPRIMFYSLIRTPERKSLYKWVGPFGEEAIYFYKRKGSNLQIKTLADAMKVGRVCCRNMGLVYTTLKKSGFKNLDVGVNPEGLYLKTINGRCDLAIGETSEGVAYWLKKSNVSPELLERTSVKVSSSPLYFTFSKDVPDREILQWQNALDKVKASSEYGKLYREYELNK